MSQLRRQSFWDKYGVLITTEVIIPVAGWLWRSAARQAEAYFAAPDEPLGVAKWIVADIRKAWPDDTPRQQYERMRDAMLQYYYNRGVDPAPKVVTSLLRAAGAPEGGDGD